MSRLSLLVMTVGLAFAAPVLAQDPGGPLGAGPLVPSEPEKPPLTQAPEEAWHFTGAGFGIGAAAAAFTVAPTVFLAGQLGTLSSGLIGAAVPGLLTLLFVPPLITTLAIWTFANLTEGGFRFHPAIWAGLGAHLVVVVVAGLLGAAANQPGDMILLTLADAVLVPAATLAVMHHTRLRPAPGVNLKWEF